LGRETGCPRCPSTLRPAAWHAAAACALSRVVAVRGVGWRAAAVAQEPPCQEVGKHHECVDPEQEHRCDDDVFPRHCGSPRLMDARPHFNYPIWRSSSLGSSTSAAAWPAPRARGQAAPSVFVTTWQLAATGCQGLKGRRAKGPRTLSHVTTDPAALKGYGSQQLNEHHGSEQRGGERFTQRQHFGLRPASMQR
jgi:hypothetical protein